VILFLLTLSSVYGSCPSWFYNWVLEKENLTLVSENGRPESLVALPDGTFFTSDAESGVLLVNGSSRRKYGNLPTEIVANGIGLDANGNLFVADLSLPGRLYVIDKEERTTLFWNNTFHVRGGLVNAVDIDSKGRKWVTVSTARKDPLVAFQHVMPDGYLVRIDADGTASVVAKDLFFPNEVRLHPSEKFLLVAESSKSRLMKFDIDEDGSLKNKSVYVDLLGAPDGFSFDEEGNVWVSILFNNAISVVCEPNAGVRTTYTPFSETQTENLSAFIQNLKAHRLEPSDLGGLFGPTVQFPTSLTFGGENLDTIYISSLINKVYSFKAPIKGAKRVHWDRWNELKSASSTKDEL